uniref:LamG domain-containing protein n=1 Tax=Roseihalotalea indica TaxID=2867963 RepID=A0AA49JCB7_9BACT|nr:LamG domain-containing protein [Tunicatimonas sp. TK19036]
MKNLLWFVLLAFGTLHFSYAQVLNPNDPIVEYNPNNPPSTPPGGTIAKWVITPSVNWNSNNWKSYYFNGMAFRLRFPNNYNANRAEKYPMIVILHGLGFQDGTIYMNDQHLNNSGAKDYEQAVNKGNFDGFVLSPQSTGGWFNSNHINTIDNFIDQATEQVNLDINRVSVNGRSGGAQAVWQFILEKPRTYAGAVPMSGVKNLAYDNIDAYKHIPLWVFQGELDEGPSPVTTEALISAVVAKKAKVKYTKYKEAGHSIFDKAYDDSDYFPFYERANKTNPTVLKGEYALVFDDNKKWVYEFLTSEEICPGDNINITLGLTAGYNGYEWRKNGILIPGANSNTLQVTELGTYDARIKRGNQWSYWSPRPVVVKVKAPTVTPDIQIVGKASKVLPALDGKTSVALELPQGYDAYEWRKVGSNTVLSTSRVFEASSPGEYVARVNEKFGCSSNNSNPFSVVNANASNGPEKPLGFNGYALNKTDIKLVWSINPNDPNPASGFEIYRSLNQNSGYEFVELLAGNKVDFVDSELVPNTTYYYKLRAVNNKAASASTNFLQVKTLVDVTSPTAPTQLTLTEMTSNSASLTWNASTDDVGVYRYDIYRNGIKALTTENTSITVFNLQPNNIYKFLVKARDITGNESPFSNRVVGVTSVSSSALVNYKFNSDYSDQSANGVNSNPQGNLSFSSTDKVEGGASLSFNGTNGILDLDINDQFIHNSFDQRSVAFWLKANTVAGTQDVFDEGGSTNGIGMRLKGGKLEFAVRNSNKQATISASFTANEWHHVAGVFDKSKLTLFIDGAQVAVNNNVTYTTVSTHSDAGGLGGTNGSNAFNQNSSNLSGLIDDFYMYPTALTPTQIDQLINLEGIVTIPNENIAAPENVKATAQSYNKILLEWDDVSNNENQFQIFRSESGGEYMSIALLPANTEQYTDNNLKASTTYAYKVVALTEYNASSEEVVNIPASSLYSLKFNNNLQDASGKGTNTQNQDGISYSTSDKKEGSHAIQFSGNAYLDLDVGNKFIHDEFNKRSIAFWFKSTNATGTQDIVDEGGSTNGIGIRLINNELQLTVQNSHAIFSVQAPITRNAWHHVVGIFDNGSLRLYVNGTLADQRNDVSYNTVSSHGDAGGLGGTNGSNAFDVSSAKFTGFIDDFYMFGDAVDALVPAIMAVANATNQATTFPLPPAPAAPTNLVATNVDFTEITISFKDNSNNEDYFEVWRSINNDLSFQLVETITQYTTPTITYTDKDLQNNINYFYKVIAVNPGGRTESAVLSTKTRNHTPELDGISDLTIRFGEEYDLQLYGSDQDGDALTISGSNLPSFASLSDYGDGSGLLRFSPQASDQGEYANIQIRLQDSFGGVATETFTLRVNDNFLPTLSAVADVTLAEGTSQTLTLEASDNEGTESLSWSSSLPSFASLQVQPGGTALLTLAPGFADAGTYPSRVSVTDGQGGEAATSFTITVSQQNPNTLVRVNFTDGSLVGGSGWNNTSGHPVQGASYQNLTDVSGQATSFDLVIGSNWTSQGSNTLGASTGNNSGIYPDNVLKSAYWTSAGTETVRLEGLDDSRSYTLTFLGSRQANDDRSTRYSVGGQSVVLNAAGNTSQTVSLTNLSPSNGQLSFTIARTGGSSYGYLNALVIEERYETGNAPAVPTDLAASFDAVESQVVVSWKDRAFNESGYRVYRSGQAAGPFTLLAELSGVDLTTYTDMEISSNTTYYYQVSAYNGNGESAPAGPLTVVVPNIAPVLTSLDDVQVEVGKSLTLPVIASDDASDQITLTALQLPSFATFSVTGNGTGSLSLHPQAGDLGQYTITVRAEDQHQGVSTESFTLTVLPSGLHQYYVNFAGSPAFAAGSPWSNYTGSGGAGDVLNNITVAEGSFGALSLRLLDGWNGYNTNGMSGSSLYPDNVTRSALWVSGTQDRRIRISGLGSDQAYDFTFFASRDAGGNRTTNYRINGVSVSLEAANNQNQTVSIRGVLADSNGEVLITVNKAGSASYGYLNALVITGYQAAAIPATPTELVATPVNGSSISLQWQDNTPQETGYEIWRSSSSSSSGYSRVATTGVDATSYTNSGLSKGITYYYKVRALLNDGSQSDYSNVAGTSTINATVSINFNVTDPQAGWNNTNSLPDAGLIFSNLRNENNSNTGIAFQIVEQNPAYDPSLYGFSGDNPFGENTGNNSGVVPDNVMRSTWWMDPGRTAELRFFGLDLSQQYNFTFFASRAGNGNRTSVYSINGQSVKLNAANNINQVVRLSNVAADDNGEIVVRITSDAGALFSYLGAIIIESANRVDAGATARLASQSVSGDEEAVATPGLGWERNVQLYPNPYGGREALQLRIDGNQDAALWVRVYDLQGMLVHEQHQAGLQAQSEVLLEVKMPSLSRGAYVLSVSGAQGGTQRQRLLIE